MKKSKQFLKSYFRPIILKENRDLFLYRCSMKFEVSVHKGSLEYLIY